MKTILAIINLAGRLSVEERVGPISDISESILSFADSMRMLEESIDRQSTKARGIADLIAVRDQLIKMSVDALVNDDTTRSLWLAQASHRIAESITKIQLCRVGS